MSVYEELKALLGRPEAGALTIHMDFSGEHLSFHFAEAGLNPRGVMREMSVKMAEARRAVGPDEALAGTLTDLRLELEQQAQPSPRNLTLL